MVAGEDGVDQLGRQEGQRQDAADLGRINAVGGCDVGEAFVGAVSQLLMKTMRAQNQIDQSSMGSGFSLAVCRTLRVSTPRLRIVKGQSMLVGADPGHHSV